MDDVKKRFDKYVVIPKDYINDCWGWSAGTCEFGYGRLGIGNNKVAKAHRLSWQFFNGPVPEGLHVLHRCDNPPCCNPNHLFLGTNADNVADKEAKGRGNHATGDRHGMAKLCSHDIPDIKRLHAEGYSGAKIAAEYGVCYSTIRRILSGAIWKKVE